MRARWRAGLVCTGASVLLLAGLFLSDGGPAQPLVETTDRIVVNKGAHTMSLYHHGQARATYRVALGRGGSGPKMLAGDNRVPEGTYPIVSRNLHSAFYRSLRIGYPTEEQRQVAQRRGLDPGGDIMIHGIRNGLGWVGASQSRIDWTKGCIAVTNAEMDQIWSSVAVGTLVEILP